jgi:S1-C subfamily serine protease
VPVQGIFFAIPVNTAKEIANELIATGAVLYPYAGISALDINPEFASILGLPVDHGAIVQSVSPGGPGDKAGIQRGDIILAISGQTLDAKHPFVDVLFSHKPGETVQLSVQRGDQQLTVPVTLEARPPQMETP